MNKSKKIVNIIIIAMLLISVVSTFSMAAAGAKNPSGYTGGETNVDGLEKIGNQLITIVSTVGSIASVIVLVILGLKYMMGSAEEKAEYKKTLMPYVIGAGLVFAASAIAGIIYGFTQTLGG